MISPAFLLGIILATLYGTIFHFWRGGSFGRLLFYIILSWIGFWSGNYFGNTFHSNFIKLGTLQAGSATIGAIICLLIGYWLSLIRIETQ